MRIHIVMRIIERVNLLYLLYLNISYIYKSYIFLYIPLCIIHMQSMHIRTFKFPINAYYANYELLFVVYQRYFLVYRK